MTTEEQQLVERLRAGLETKYGSTHDGSRVIVTAWLDTEEASARMREAAATITRLVEERDEALAQLHRVTSPDYLAEVLSKVGVVDEARATASEAKVAELQEALKPFAAMASDYDPDEGDDADLAWLEHPKIGWLRAARRALEASK